MKKLFFAMIVCAGFCACSNDDVVVTTTPNEALGEATAYLKVNIKDVNSGTRATGGDFAYGTEAEQTVNNAYFYFYDDNGVYAAKGSLGSISGTAATESTPGNIEWNSGTVVAVYGLQGDVFPTKMVTVLNKPSGLDLTNKSLEEAVAALATTPYADASGNFVMSTSVYSSSGVVNYTALKETDFAEEPFDFDNDYPEGGVAVYVERLAAKVAVNASEGLTSYIDLTKNLKDAFVMGAPEGGIYVKLDGFDVDGVARDAYVLKNISDNANWSGLTFVWNGAANYRCYWAESPNYGDTQTVYPTSSNGNTATEEGSSSTWLNEYLRYVDLKSPVELGSATYCGENTNTTTVITSADNNGLTNVLVKGTVYTLENENYVPLDIVEFHGAYYTADQFVQKCVDDVVTYDFTIVVDEVIAALEDKYSSLTTYLEDLNGAIVKDHIYKSTANTNHKYGTGVEGPSSVSAFGGEMLSLYNVVDGNVTIFYNMTTQPQWGDGTDSSPFTNIDNTLWSKYPESSIVYNSSVDLDTYDFWFHVDQTKFENFLTKTGLTAAGLLYEVNGEYYMPIDNSISFTTQAMGDDNFSGGHTYTTRNFLLRTITVEADGIDGEFGSHYPNLYANGEMYYHVPIEHLGTATEGSTDLVEGQYGVVRNHYYNVTITSLENLGRGIADPDEVIVPLPEVDYYYLGADINILSWKMVNQEVGF